MPLTRALLAASVTAPAGRKVAAPTGGLFAGGSTILAPLGLLEAPSLHPLAGSWPPRLAGCRWQHGPRTPWPAGSVVTAPAGRKLAAPRLAGCRWQHNPRTPWPAGSSVIAPAGRKLAAPTGGLPVAARSSHPLACWQRRHRTRWQEAGRSPTGGLPVAAQSSHPLACWQLRHCTRWQEAGRPDWRAAGGSTVLAPVGLLAPSVTAPAGGRWPPLTCIAAPLGGLTAVAAWLPTPRQSRVGDRRV